MRNIVRFEFGKWIIDVDIEATKKHYKMLELQFNDIPSHRKYSATQCFRNYTSYCNAMPSEEKSFFNAFGIAPEYSKVLGFRLDKDCNYYVHGNYFIIGSIVIKPADTIWNEKPDVCIGKYQFTFLHPEWFHAPMLGNIPEMSVIIHFRVEGIPWLLEEECEQKYCNDSPEIAAYKRAKIMEYELENVLKNINSYFRKMSEQESRDYMCQWFKRVVPVDKREEAKSTVFQTL